MSEIDPYGEFEQEASALLGQVGDDAEGTAYVLLKRFRKLAKEHPLKVERIREQVRAELLAEQVEARKVEAAWRRADIPEPVRPLFDGIDPADEQALAARSAELRAFGLVWGDQPAAPPPPDPNLQAMQQMQAAQAGGDVEGNGNLEHRLERMARDPGAYSDEQRRQVVDEVNARVRAAANPYSAGAAG